MGTNLLDITDISVSWKGASCRLTREAVLKAFNRAQFGNQGSNPRYFMEIDGDIKSVDSVFREIVTVQENLDESEAAKVAHAFESLGFDVLDRRKHHIC
jgi:hypothetical protein